MTEIMFKSCPFCGGAAFYRGFGNQTKSIGWGECSACHAKGPSREDPENAAPAAAAAWNRRAV